MTHDEERGLTLTSLLCHTQRNDGMQPDSKQKNSEIEQFVC